MKRSEFVAARPRRGSRSLCALSVIALAVGWLTAPKPALAAPQVRGTPDAVRIEAHNASVGEILAALGRKFDLHFTTSAKLERPVTGFYQGALERVVARLLAGHNFVLKTKGGRIDVTVLGSPKGSQSVASSAPAPQKVAAHKPVGRPTSAPATVAQKSPPKTQPNPSSIIRLAASTDAAPTVGVVHGKGPELKPSTLSGPILTPNSGPQHDVAIGPPKSSGPEISAATAPRPASKAPPSPSTTDKPAPSPK